MIIPFLVWGLRAKASGIKAHYPYHLKAFWGTHGPEGRIFPREALIIKVKFIYPISKDITRNAWVISCLPLNNLLYNCVY